MTKLTYTDDSIKTMDGLNPIRVRPTAFIGSLDAAGQTHIAKEILDNSFDEINNGNKHGTVVITIFRDRKRKTYQMMIADNGRGFPLGKFVDSLSKMWTSGKYHNNAYESSGGSYGLGAKCQSALSIRSKAITLRQEGAGVLLMSRGIVLHESFVPNPTPSFTGTWILYELEKKWEAQGNKYEFLEMEDFAEAGFLDLVKLIRINDIFSENIRCVVEVIDIPLPEQIWSADIDLPTTLNILRNLETLYTPVIVYDTDAVADKAMYLLEYLKSDTAVVASVDMEKFKRDPNDKLSFKIRMLLTSGMKKMGMLVLVNNIVMLMENNSPQLVFQRVFHTLIAGYIQDTELRKFFLSSGYLVPIQIALSVRYSGAQFAGTTKNTFKDKTFEVEFQHDLMETFKSVDPEKWRTIAELITPDLENKYAIFYNKPMKVKDTKKLLLELKNPNNYTACRTTNRAQAELFIVEGTSAGHLKKEINDQFQAIMETRGKPLNAVNVSEDRRIAFQKLKENEIFSDLIKIIGITPGTTDMSQASFGKIIITTDADADGEHIVALYLTNLYILNPRILESGMVYLATPPLFVMNIRNKKMYLRDKLALYDARIKFIYSNTMDFYINSIAHPNHLKLTGDSYRDFCYMVMNLGEAFENVSKVLNIPLLVLERLTYGIDYLIPSVNIEKLSELFATDDPEQYIRISHHVNMNMLILSIGEEDIPISLAQLGEVIQKQLLHLLIPIKWRDWYPLISTKLSDGMNQQPCTLMQVYTAMSNLDKNKMIRIDRYKGLGEMHPEDMRKTIADPATRTLYRITSIGEAHRIFELMGKDSYQRKVLMSEAGTLTTSVSRSALE